jgi:hypothetical protein
LTAGKDVLPFLGDSPTNLGFNCEELAASAIAIAMAKAVVTREICPGIMK